MALSHLAADRDAHRLFAVPWPPSTSVGQQDLLDVRKIILVGFDGQGVAPPHAHPALVIESAVISGTLEDPCSADRFHVDVPAAPVGGRDLQLQPIEQSRTGNEIELVLNVSNLG